jgi:hypothetical protein
MTTNWSGPLVSDNGFQGTLTGPVIAATPVNCTTAALTVTQALHAGVVVTLNRAAGIAVTLPSPTGTGAVYAFYIGTAVTSNTTTFKVPTHLQLVQGSILQTGTAGAATAFRSATSDDTITLNGTTTGGAAPGGLVQFVDVATGVFMVDGSVKITGVAATPFSSTV